MFRGLRWAWVVIEAFRMRERLRKVCSVITFQIRKNANLFDICTVPSIPRETREDAPPAPDETMPDSNGTQDPAPKLEKGTPPPAYLSIFYILNWRTLCA